MGAIQDYRAESYGSIAADTFASNRAQELGVTPEEYKALEAEARAAGQTNVQYYLGIKRAREVQAEQDRQRAEIEAAVAAGEVSPKVVSFLGIPTQQQAKPQQQATQEFTGFKYARQEAPPGTIFPENVVDAPFFSAEGQKQRAKNVVNVLGLSLNPFTRADDVQVSPYAVRSRGARQVGELIFNRPYSTALIAGSGAQAGRVGVGLFGRLSGRQVAKATAGKGADVVAQAARTASGRGDVIAQALRSAGGRAATQQAARRAAQTAGREGFSRGFLNPLARGTQQAFVSGATGAGIVRGSEFTGYLTAPEEQREFFFDAGAIGRARERERAKAGEGILSSVADAIAVPLGDVATRGQTKAEFKAGAKEFFEEQGLKGKELATAVDAVTRRRTSAGWGEVGSLLAISAQTERFAQRELAKSAQRVGFQNLPTKEALKRIRWPAIRTLGIAGAGEGASQVAVQDFARQQPFSPKRVGFGAGIGAISAASLGYPIISGAVQRKGFGKVFQGFGYLADPYELPGDLLASAYTKAKTGLGFRFAVPSFAISPGKASFTATPSQAQTPAQTARAKARVRSNLFDFGITPTPAQTKRARGPRAPPGFTPPGTTPADTPAQTPASTPADTFTRVGTQTQTQTQTTTPSFITNINVPAITPQLRIPPPVPLGLGLGTGGGRGRASRGRKQFVDELSAGLSLFKGLTGGPKPKERDFIIQRGTPKQRRKAAQKTQRTASQAISKGLQALAPKRRGRKK